MTTYPDKTIASIVAAILVATALAMATTSVAAQTTTPNAAPSAASKPAAPKNNLKVSPTTSRTELKSAAQNVAALTPAELAIAERVHVGRIPCELGTFVTVDADKKLPGYFDIQGKSFKFRMHPVESRTGAIRLEDPRAGAMWLQLGNKSMLMSQKLGQRLADECMSPVQVTFADEMEKNPPVSILEALPATANLTPALAGTGSAQPALPAATGAAAEAKAE